MSFNQYTVQLQSLLNNLVITDKQGNVLTIDEGFDRTITAINRIKSSEKKVMIIGNGGSAAIASHLQNDLCKAVRIRAMVFTEPPLLTALSNDICYAAAYQELVRLWADKGDILFSISSSGRSQNIIDAVRAAWETECSLVITLSGFSPDNSLRKMGDINFYVSSNEYGYVELIHSILAHYISDMTGNKSNKP